jgi:hypothetical protein
MHRLVGLLVGTVAATAASILPDVAPARTVAPVGGATAVREYAGTIVFSQLDQNSSRWYLAVRRAGATEVERLPVAPAAVPFEADIGPDGQGRPALVYQRCSGRPAAPTDCDLFVFSLSNGTGERRVRNANHPRLNDMRPTLWRGRIAWTREYGSGRNANPVVYTRKLTAPTGRRSTRLPGAPKRRCGDSERFECGPTINRSVQALELRGKRLALIVLYHCPGCSGFAWNEVRLGDLTRRGSRLVAFQIVGLSSQSYVGPSLFAGRLAWYSACPGAPSRADCPGPNAGSPFRHVLSSRRYEKGGRGPAGLVGFADTGSRLYEVVGCSAPPPHSFETPCRIEEAAPPDYEAARAPLPGRR